MTIEMIPVDDLYVQCSYPMRPDGIAMSDCCRNTAHNAVINAAGNYLYRCGGHTGWVKRGVPGKISSKVPRKVS